MLKYITRVYFWLLCIYIYIIRYIYIIHLSLGKKQIICLIMLTTYIFIISPKPVIEKENCEHMLIFKMIYDAFEV